MHTTHAAGNGHISADWMNMPEWITITEASEATGYEVNYLRKVMRQGKIAGQKKGLMWWVDKDSLQAYVTLMQTLGNQRFSPKGIDYKRNG